MKKLSQRFNKVIVTGGGGFIGNNFIRNIINRENIKIFNIDKVNYCSDKNSLKEFSSKHSENYKFFQIDLFDFSKTKNVIEEICPDLIIHFAAESHVDRSIDSPRDFLNSNIIGTFNLLEATRLFWKNLNIKKKSLFRFLHVSTDEVFGSLGDKGYFSENSLYQPSSPYSASKAASDHLVNGWYKTYGLPVITTNCSNNYGPWQYPEKLIPLTIKRILSNKKIPIYGNGLQKRDWLFVDDHIEALITILNKSEIGKKYCIGNGTDITNLDLVKMICNIMDKEINSNNNSENLIEFVKDRLGHDYRYSIDSSLIRKELLWHPKYDINNGIQITINWFLNNKNWNQF